MKGLTTKFVLVFCTNSTPFNLTSLKIKMFSFIFCSNKENPIIKYLCLFFLILFHSGLSKFVCIYIFETKQDCFRFKVIFFIGTINKIIRNVLNKTGKIHKKSNQVKLHNKYKVRLMKLKNYLPSLRDLRKRLSIFLIYCCHLVLVFGDFSYLNK